MNKIRLLYSLLSLLTLIAGMVIYLLFRNINNMVLFEWLPKPVFPDMFLVPLQPSGFTNFFRFNLPDMLWFVSAILFFRFFWFYKIKTQTVYILCFYVIGLVLETSQLLKRIPGTFDWFDLLFMSIGAFVESLLYKNFIKRRIV